MEHSSNDDNTNVLTKDLLTDTMRALKMTSGNMLVFLDKSLTVEDIHHDDMITIEQCNCVIKVIDVNDMILRNTKATIIESKIVIVPLADSNMIRFKHHACSPVDTSSEQPVSLDAAESTLL